MTGSVLTFLGISVYLIYNSYELELKKFDFSSNPIVSACFFNAKMNYHPFKDFASDFDSFITKREMKSDEQESMISKLKEAFIYYSKMDSIIEKDLLENGFRVNIDFAISLAKLSNVKMNNDPFENEGKRMGEVVLFGNTNLVGKTNYKSFSKWVGDYYMEIRMHYEYNNIWKYIIGEIKWLIFGIVLATIIFVAIFVYTIQTIIRQKKLSDIKNDFINNMTHELNTPISTIRIASQNLKKQEVKTKTEKIDELADILLRQNKRLQIIVSDVMKLSVKNSNTSNAYKFEKTSVNQLLSELIKDFQTAHQEFEIEQKFIAKTDEIMLDSFYFSSAIINILDNASKYSVENKKIEITTTNKNKQLIIHIKDYGIGISKKEQVLIFDKFYRIPKGNIHTVKGLGLGLFVVKQIIQAHQGKIEVESKIGKGSTFIIYLPIT